MPEPIEEIYAIPAEYRKMENTHILFWLVKDICWCLVVKWLGIAMIFPTLGIALVIAWRTRHLKSELTHNLAIVFWITANSYWMLSEFSASKACPSATSPTASTWPSFPLASAWASWPGTTSLPSPARPVRRKWLRYSGKVVSSE